MLSLRLAEIHTIPGSLDLNAMQEPHQRVGGPAKQHSVIGIRQGGHPERRRVNVGVITMSLLELGVRAMHEDVKEQDKEVRRKGTTLPDARTLPKLVRRVNTLDHSEPGILVDVAYHIHNVPQEAGPPESGQEPGV